jgi:hypothetical protein
MPMARFLLRYSLLITLISFGGVWALQGTNGTPLGGIGTGYVIYNAKTGQLAALTKVMPAASLGANEFGYSQSSSCGLHFFVGNGAVPASKLKAVTNDENAAIPIYSAIFPPVGGVTFADTSFGPFISGLAWDQLAHSPLAFFDVKANNANASACTVAVALEFSNQTSGGINILGGTNAGTSDGNNAITWGGDTTIGFAYMMAGCDNNAATFSSGAIGNFTTTGTLTQGAGNIVSAKCLIPAGGSARFRFVMSWWTRWILSPASAAKPGAEDHWYNNFYANAKECAVYGMANYEKVLGGATAIVKRTMGSNFPEWYKERLLNNCYPLIHNSVAAKDGRTGYWEGQYSIIGTIDQAEHAALWYVFNWPQNQWRELQSWARSAQKTGDYLGQIHHDLNGTSSFSTWRYDNTDDNHFLYPFDNSTHADYSYQADTRNWMDLNCMFIFKAYELMLATGNKDSMTVYWPYIKNTANRIIKTCTPSHLPTTSLSSYDSPNAQNFVYPSACALTAWLAVIEMAKWLGDAETVTKYTDWYTAARAEFVTTYASLSSFANEGDINHPEGDVAGYSWGRYFGLPATIDSQYIARACNNLYNTYSILSGQERLGLWHFYQYDHMGGALTAIGMQDKALDVHNWDYEFYHAAAPAFVYWQDLWNTNSNYQSYTTAASAWRSYFQFTGTLLDNANNRLWVRPMVPTTMGKKIVNAPIVNPKGWGTLNYDENPVDSRRQAIIVSFDSLITIKEIVLKNNTTVAQPGVSIKQNGTPVAVTAAIEGSGFEKNIRVTFTSPIQIGPQGISLCVYDGPVPAGVKGAGPYRMHYSLCLQNDRLTKGFPVRYSVDQSGPVYMELIGINGSKLGALMNGNVSAGQHSFVWNGKTLHGVKVNAGIAILRLNSAGNSISRMVYIRQ